MEGTPFAVENSSEADKEQEDRKAKVKKPEALGILAIEPAAEKEPSPLERVLAAIRPKAEAEEKPAAEKEPAALPETNPPVERVPEEKTRRIVQEMITTEQQPEAGPTGHEEEPAHSPEPASAARVESGPVEVPETPAPERPTTPAPIEKPAVEIPDAAEFSKKVEKEPGPVPAVTPEPAAAPEAEEAPRPHVETEPIAAPVPASEKPAQAEKPVEKPVEKPAEDKKKPNRLRSLFRRPKKTEKKPAAVQEAIPVEKAPVKKKKQPEGPKFQFKEKTTEEDAPPSETVSEKPEESPRKAKPKPERIGKVVLGTEALAGRQVRPVTEAAESSKTAEEKMKVKSSPVEPVSGKHVDTLSRGELMELGAKIEVNGSNLRHIYETHLIGERGLRRLIAEHLRGGDLTAALRREVMEHEIDFERDPMMRDSAAPVSAPVDISSHALEKLLEKADVSLADNGEQAAIFTAQAQHQTAAEERYSHQRRMLDITLIATISFLMILILVIALIR